MAYRAFCDNLDCNAPIAPTDNRIEMPSIGIVDRGQVFRAENLHFCGKGCLCKWLDKATSRPLIVQANGAQIQPFPGG